MFTDPWTLDGSLNAYGSLGIHVAADGTVDDAWPGMPAFDAGVTNGMKIVAVNGRRFSSDELTRALARLEGRGRRRMEFIVENGSYFKTVTVDYHGGLRYPHLERATGVSDVLTAIARARQYSLPSLACGQSRPGVPRRLRPHCHGMPASPYTDDVLRTNPFSQSPSQPRVAGSSLAWHIEAHNRCPPI